MKKVLLLFYGVMIYGGNLDVVIPVHRKDAQSLNFIIDKVEELIEDVGNIYVISKEKYTDRAIWIDEETYPFTINEVAKEIGNRGGVGAHKRSGWYFQQILKLYTPKVVSNLSEHFLILDADTIPTHKVQFLCDDGRVVHNVKVDGGCFSRYYEHMEKILPELGEIDDTVNPIVNHMVFSKTILEDLFVIVENRYKKEFWKVFLNMVDVSGGLNTRGFQLGASEYLIYYHFCRNYHPETILVKPITVFSRARSFELGPRLNKYDFITRHLFIQ